ncbi:MAG: ATP-binding cassette domain-containing protein, partial [Chloroflexi bacterium]|nr:ATP-binding cassette domain-containing protein [Chloroflexota bacterium]
MQFEDHGGNWAEASAPLGISMEDVTFTYENGDQPAVSNLTFELPPGGFLAVVGHTGSGKTTLGRLIAREVETGRGNIKIGSRDAWVDLATVPEVQLRRMVAVVNQDVALFHASVRDNVTMFDPEVPDAAVMSALDRVGLGPWLASLPDGVATHLSPAGGREQSHGRIGGRVGTGGLSAGESQLLALARVFLGNARLVVLDEPAARIDPVTEVRLIDALDALARDRTVMVIAHRPSTIGHASHVAVMEAGCLVAFGPSNDPAVSRFIAPGVAPDIATDPAPMTPVTVARNKAPTDTDIGFGPSDSTTTDRSATVSVWPVLGGLIRAMTWWWLGSVVMAGFVGYVIGLVPGLVIREFLDAASSMARGGDPSPLIWLGALIFLFGVGRGIHMAITATIEPTTQTMGSGMLIAACFSGVMQSRRYPALPGSPGEAVSRFRDDTLVIGRFATWLGDPFGQLALGVGAFVVLWSRDPQVAVASVAPIVLAMVVSQAASGPVQRARQAAQAGVASVTDLLGDVFA